MSSLSPTTAGSWDSSDFTLWWNLCHWGPQATKEQEPHPSTKLQGHGGVSLAPCSPRPPSQALRPTQALSPHLSSALVKQGEP
jgi:hypothetical protein